MTVKVEDIKTEKFIPYVQEARRKNEHVKQRHKRHKEDPNPTKRDKNYKLWYEIHWMG